MYYSRQSIDTAMSANICQNNLFRDIMIFEDVLESGLEEKFKEDFNSHAPSLEEQKGEFYQNSLAM